MELNGNEIKEEIVEEVIIAEDKDINNTSVNEDLPTEVGIGEFEIATPKDFEKTKSGEEYTLLNDIELKEFNSEMFKGIKLKGNDHTITLTGTNSIINLGKNVTLTKLKFAVKPENINVSINDEKINELKNKINSLELELEKSKSSEIIKKDDIVIENNYSFKFNIGDELYLAKFGALVESGMYQKVENIYKFRPKKERLKEIIFDGTIKYKFVGSNAQYTEDMIATNIKDCEDICARLNS